MADRIGRLKRHGIKMKNTPKQTMTSSESALEQFASEDGKHLLSLVRNGDHFRYVEEQETHEPASSAVPAYDYWEESYRSGLYETASEALLAAEREVSWINLKPTE